MKKLCIFLIFTFLLTSCIGDVTEVTNRDNKVIGTYEEHADADIMTIEGHNPVDIEYAFKVLKRFNKDISDTFKQKLISGETGIWIFNNTRLEVHYDKENLIVKISGKGNVRRTNQ